MEAYLEGGVHGFRDYPEFELKAAIQLIKGKDFKEGTLEISDKEYMAAVEKAGASEKLNTKVGIL